MKGDIEALPISSKKESFKAAFVFQQASLSSSSLWDHIKTSIAILTNISSSIGIVLLNKLILQHYKFNYSIVLTILHFAITFIGLYLASLFGIFRRKTIEMEKMIMLCVSFCLFVVLTNFSLEANSIGFYQVLTFW